MGLFHEFIQDKEVRLIGIEPTTYLVDKDKYVTTLQNGVIGDFLGGTTYMLANPDDLVHDMNGDSGDLMWYGAGQEVIFLKDLGCIECYTIAQKKQPDVHIFTL
ncbi:hypothetical protein LXL04_037462 [Taraxacum kok-saghyz]